MQREMDPPAHHLERAVHLLPDERRPQHRVPVHDPLPRLCEGLGVQVAVKGEAELPQVHAAAVRGEGVEQHPLCAGDRGYMS